jgi:hypothetical protein
MIGEQFRGVRNLSMPVGGRVRKIGQRLEGKVLKRQKGGSQLWEKILSSSIKT